MAVVEQKAICHNSLHYIVIFRVKMPRPSYKIKNEDYSIAMEYLLNKFKYSGGYPYLIKCLNEEELQSWCDEYISDVQFKKLKQVIWATRKRNSDKAKFRENPTKQMSISKNALKVTNLLCKSDKMTQSQVIENYLGALAEMPKKMRDDILTRWL